MSDLLKEFCTLTDRHTRWN